MKEGLNFRRTIKKIAALGTSMSMVGLTLMGATAQDASVSSLLKGGALLTVGDAAAASDAVAALDMAKRFGGGYTKTTSSGGSEGSSDSYMVGTSSDKLEIGESLRDIETFIGEDELSALADISGTNEKGSYSYDQDFYFNDSATSHVIYTEDDDDNIGWFFYTASSNPFGRLVLDSATAAKSDNDANGRLEDLEDKEIQLGTKKYTVVKWTNATAPVMTLMSGSSKVDISQHDEPQVVTIDGTEYSVSASFVDTTKARLVINGESIELDAGETGVTKDGLNIGVSKVYSQNFQGGVQSAVVYLGATRAVITSGSSPDIDGSTVTDVTNSVSLTQSGGDSTWDQLEWNITAFGTDLYIAPGEKFSEQTELAVEERAVLTSLGLDLWFEGFAEQSTEEISFRAAGGDTKYEIEMTNADGLTFKIPFAFSNSSGVHLGEKTGRELFLSNSVEGGIAKNQYFILNTKSPVLAANDARSYVVQYKGADKSTATNPQMTFDILGGDTLTRPVSSTNTSTIKLGGTSFTASYRGTKDGTMNITAGGAGNPVIHHRSGRGNVTTASNSLRTSGNLRINISYYPVNYTGRGAGTGGLNNGTVAGGTAIAAITGENATIELITSDGTRTEADDVILNETVKFVKYRLTVNSDNEIATARATSPTYSQTDNDDSTVTWLADRYGIEAKETNPSSSPRTIEITAPLEQRFAKFWMLAESEGSSGSTTTSTYSSAGVAALEGVTGTMTATDLSKGNAVALQSEVPEGYSGSVVHVGGPCVNPGTATALGLTFPACGEAAKTASSTVAASGDSVAMVVGDVGLVYGWDAADTTSAAAGVKSS